MIHAIDKLLPWQLLRPPIYFPVSPKALKGKTPGAVPGTAEGPERAGGPILDAFFKEQLDETRKPQPQADG